MGNRAQVAKAALAEDLRLDGFGKPALYHAPVHTSLPRHGVCAFANGMQHAKADAIAQKGAFGLAVELKTEAAIGVPAYRPSPDEMDVVLAAVGVKRQGELFI